MKIALIDIETLSPQYRPKLTDVITGIGIGSEEGNWIKIIEPSGGRSTDMDEANLIYDAIQHLKEIRPDVLTGCYILGFDIPRLICRAKELGYAYQRFAGRELSLELERTLNGLKIVDLAKIDYVLNDLAKKYGKSYLKVEEICKELNIETKEFPEDFHVWASAKAVAGDQKHLVKRLENDLREEWAILQKLMSQKKLKL